MEEADEKESCKLNRRMKRNRTKNVQEKCGECNGCKERAESEGEEETMAKIKTFAELQRQNICNNAER